ncbi:hypothetical protein F2Q69_00052953 [Brassica cretica]|uniref:Uncharacterized protein n=1 Tax=Brassica cretica TaxID=69181 RepID=A0A8S9MRY6_BRACR|nr:hypothetical protein F2Q69_00052953 [Brassica cretica]
MILTSWGLTVGFKNGYDEVNIQISGKYEYVFPYEYDDRNTDEPSSVITQLPHMHAVRSLRSDRAFVPLGRYVETELEPKLVRYVATDVHSARSLRSDRARTKARSLRSDREYVPLGRYVATELEHSKTSIRH